MEDFQKAMLEFIRSEERQMQLQELILKVTVNAQQKHIEKEATFSQDAVLNTIETFK